MKNSDPKWRKKLQSKKVHNGDRTVTVMPVVMMVKVMV